MRGKRLDVVLVPSAAMEKAKEHKIVRVPSNVRKKAEFRRKAVSVLGHRLEVHQALSKDIAKMKKEKKLKQVPLVGFVSQTVFKRVAKGTRKEAEGWISEATEPLKIGCDPEFVLLDKDTKKYVYAGDGWNTEIPSAYMPHSGEFASDGPCAEIRPKEASTVETLVKRIGDILNKNTENAEKYLWLGGSSYKCSHRICSIGGHISLGRIENIKKEETQEVYQGICYILNDIVGLPLYRIEAPKPWNRRSSLHDGPFGRYKEFRNHSDNNGNPGRMEWRIPGGFWLCHPELAKVVLGTTKAATEAIYSIYAEEGYPDWFLTDFIEEGVGGIHEVFPKLKEPTELAMKVLNSDERITVPIAQARNCLSILDTLCKRGKTYKTYQGYLTKFRRMVEKGVKVSLYLQDNWLEGKKLIIN